MRALMDEAKGGNHVFSVDLAAQTVTAPSGKQFHFEIDPARKEKLLKGLDAIGETLQHARRHRRLREAPGAGPALAGAGMSLIVAGTVRVPPREPRRPAAAHGSR